MLSHQVEIINKKGLHARAASKLVQLAAKFASRVQLSLNGQVSDGKSILGVLVLAANQGSVITITTDGSDEQEAMDMISDLIHRKFDESE